jgi:Fur family zinc uptake transcriptional regulator
VLVLQDEFFYPDSWGVREGLNVNTSALHYNKKLQTAEAYFKGCDAQFTPVRRKVLEILLKNNMRAVGAYELLEDLREAGFRSQPPVAYRALEFLMKHGFVHKIERLNAFVACSLPGEEHAPAFMICRNCDVVSEAHCCGTDLALSSAIMTAGFKIEEAVVEAKGLCQTCAGGSWS